MPEGTTELVINTGPMIALVAALGDLTILDSLYERIIVPREVADELTVDSVGRSAAKEFLDANWLDKRAERIDVGPLLSSILDSGEAAVIATARLHGIDVVCIDESAGRRVARMAGLRVTGSLGILLRAKREGWPVEQPMVAGRMPAALGPAVPHASLPASTRPLASRRLENNGKNPSLGA